MTKAIKVGNLTIGGGAPISIQTMTNTNTENVGATIEQINHLVGLGADIVRVAIPTEESVVSLKKILKSVDVPIVADIHYDYKLALKAIEAGVHKIRINPSNTSPYGIKEIAALAKERGVPIRVGVNQGSIHKELNGQELAELALESAKMLEDNDFTDIVLAVKTSDVKLTVDAYRHLSKITDYPLHIGLTESGTKDYGTIKSTVALGILLSEGIGDTMRVSLSAKPEEEIFLARKILRATGREQNFVEIIACPTCGRCSIDVEGIAAEMEKQTSHIKKKIKIAVMGCAVNGIGEAEHADFGVFGGANKSVIIVNKKPLLTIKNDQIITELLNVLEKYERGIDQ